MKKLKKKMMILFSIFTVFIGCVTFTGCASETWLGIDEAIYYYCVKQGVLLGTETGEEAGEALGQKVKESDYYEPVLNTASDAVVNISNFFDSIGEWFSNIFS